VRRIALALLLVSTQALAATAYWTGEMKMVQSVTGSMVWNCKYQYAGQFFWRAFANSCPSSVEVL
jgi:hypothetical protein